MATGGLDSTAGGEARATPVESVSSVSAHPSDPGEIEALVSAKIASTTEVVRILHLSDTHGLHDKIQVTKLPKADIVIHTGDFTNEGTKQEISSEYSSFNRWLSGLRDKFKYIVVIPGNHDWRDAARRAAHSMTIDAGVAVAVGELTDPKWIKQQLSQATHVLMHEEVTLCGLRIFGSSWLPWHAGADAGDQLAGQRLATWRAVCEFQKRAGLSPAKRHRYDEIPAGVDILLSHGPASGVLDKLEGHSGTWGSSTILRRAIERRRPRAHLFGHLHEQRGVWCRPAPARPFEGGCEYKFRFPAVPSPAPPNDYPVQLISCNAMKNHPVLDGTGARLAGQARLIVAKRTVSRALAPKTDPTLPPTAAEASTTASKHAPNVAPTLPTVSAWWFLTATPGMK